MVTMFNRICTLCLTVFEGRLFALDFDVPRGFTETGITLSHSHMVCLSLKVPREMINCFKVSICRLIVCKRTQDCSSAV